MPTKQEMLAEAYRRGLLPPDKAAAYEEAQRRGVVAQERPRLQQGVATADGRATKAPQKVTVSMGDLKGALGVPETAKRPLVGDKRASGGLREQIVRKPAVAPATPAAQVGDVAASFTLSGVPKGAAGLFGSVGDAVNLAHDGGEWLAKKAGIDTQELRKRPILGAGARFGDRFADRFVTSAQINDAVQSVAGEYYRPQTKVGEYAEQIGEFIPNAFGPGGAVRKTAQVVVPALVSQGARDGAEAMGFGETGQAVAEFGGALVGGGLSSIGQTTRGAAGAEQRASAALRDAGVDPAAAPQAVRVRAQQLIEDGRRPEEVARFVAASEGLPVPIPLRRGDLTQNPTHQHAENMALRGAYGERPASIMQGAVARQQEAIRDNVAGFADQFGAGRARPVGQGATPAAETLSEMRQRGEQWVNAAYGAAREADQGSRLPMDQTAVLGARLREGLRDYDLQGVPRVARALERFDQTVTPTGVRDLFDARAQITKLADSSDTVEASAAAAARRALDGYIADALESGIVHGDEGAVDMWRSAIGARRQLGQMFEGDDLIEQLTEQVSRGGERRALKVDPGEAADLIYGRGGITNKRNLYRDLSRMRDVLGADAPEWNTLRAEHFQRLARMAEGAYEGGNRQFSGVKFQKAWEEFVRDDPRLASLLYSPEEQAAIRQFAGVASRVTAPVKGGDNSSNSAVSALKLLPAFIRNLPMAREITEGVGRQMRVNDAVRSINPTPSRVVRPRLPPAAVAASGVAAINSSKNERDRRGR